MKKESLNAERKRKREQKVVEEMISLYCRKNHRPENGELCDGCRELVDYAKLRSEKCPFMEKKTFCVNCRVHCYKGNDLDTVSTVSSVKL